MSARLVPAPKEPPAAEPARPGARGAGEKLGRSSPKTRMLLFEHPPSSGNSVLRLDPSHYPQGGSR